MPLSGDLPNFGISLRAPQVSLVQKPLQRVVHKNGEHHAEAAGEHLDEEPREGEVPDVRSICRIAAQRRPVPRGPGARRVRTLVERFDTEPFSDF